MIPELKKLETGNIFYLDVARANQNSIIALLPGETRPFVEFEIKNVRREGHAVYYTLEDQQNHLTHEFERSRLTGKLFRYRDYAVRTPLQTGDYIELGNVKASNKRDLVMRLADHPEQTFTFKADKLPRIARFERPLDLDHYLIEVQDLEKGHEVHHVIVERADVKQTISGNETSTLRMIKQTENIKCTFQEHETLRYRDVNHQMKQGSFIRSFMQDVVLYHEVMEPSGHKIAVNAKKTFRYFGPQVPKTVSPKLSPFFRTAWSDDTIMRTDLTDGVMEAFLDGAARILSDDRIQIRNLRHPDKIKILNDYLLKVMPGYDPALQAEESGVKNLAELLCTGAGVCRHKTVIFAQILNEAGYTTRMMRKPNGEWGHAWIEVDLPNSMHVLESYVVDPTEGTIKPLAQSFQDAQKKTDSPDALYYTNPSRIVVH